MMDFEKLLAESVNRHGHLCAGQIIGVRMAMLGCRLIGIDDPQADRFRKRLFVFVEIDRCASDAISSVTGCQLGKRTMKFKDYGINAATFHRTDTREAVRIVSTESSRTLAREYAACNLTVKEQQIQGYRNMPDRLLFTVQHVHVHLDADDLPGPTRRHAVCASCGQKVRDGRELLIDGRTLCRPCSDTSYFTPKRNQTYEDGKVQHPELIA